MKNAFLAFTSEQSKLLKTALLGKDRAKISGFIASAQDDVAKWQDYWPETSAEELKEHRRRLENLSKHLDSIRYELQLLPKETRGRLALHMVDVCATAPEMRIDRQMIDVMARTECFLIGMADAVAKAQSDNNLGYNNARKFELVKRLAVSYFGCFGERPTQASGSAFLKALDVICHALGLKIGKDIVGDALGAAIDECNRELALFDLPPLKQRPRKRNS